MEEKETGDNSILLTIFKTRKIKYIMKNPIEIIKKYVREDNKNEFSTMKRIDNIIG